VDGIVIIVRLLRNLMLSDRNSVRTNKGRISDHELRQHISKAQAFYIEGEGVFIDTTPDHSEYKKRMTELGRMV